MSHLRTEVNILHAEDSKSKGDSYLRNGLKEFLPKESKAEVDGSTSYCVKVAWCAGPSPNLLDHFPEDEAQESGFFKNTSGTSDAAS